MNSSLVPHSSSLLFVVGPTASGKTALAMALCEKLDGEIVSMDSMQIYRTLDIGTGKPSKSELLQTRHHLIDIINPNQTYSAAQWARAAQIAIDDIRSRGKTPVVVGGTGFYARALLFPETLASAPPDENLRVRLQQQLKKHGAQWLHNELRVLDVAAAERLEINDTRRVIRAIEVAVGGQSSVVSGHLSETHASSLIPHPLLFGLEWPRERLYRRIEKRIEQMLRDGFMEELRNLQAMKLPETATAIHSLGYKQMRAALDDESCFDECVALWKRDTRRYAKRQMTWFRHQLPTRWINVEDSSDWNRVVDEVALEYSK